MYAIPVLVSKVISGFDTAYLTQLNVSILLLLLSFGPTNPHTGLQYLFFSNPTKLFTLVDLS